MADHELIELELKIALMWESGRDTCDISQSVGMPVWLTEAQVYNMLPRIRTKRRQQKALVR